ncbi:MAG TPA: TasA family protein [Candidatus Atribacteria bacterium]|nr:TasA family protein [Candidatus Atribacteria bacterium]HPT77949.1 TasA family protein [Candidatus Atribacteria bacterium]
MKSLARAVYMLILSLVLISGGTFAFFTDSPDVPQAPFTAGRLEISIDENVQNGIGNWKSGRSDSRTVSWTFTNTGTKRAYLRARIDAAWDLPSTEDETAWAGITKGEGADAKVYGSAGGNVGRYLIFAKNEFPVEPVVKEFILAAGAVQRRAGTIMINRESSGSDRVKVVISLDPGWSMRAAKENYKMHLTNDESDFTVDAIRPGHFKYKATLTGDTLECTFDTKELSFDQAIYCAVHLDLLGPPEQAGSLNVNWMQTSAPAWIYMEDGWYYYPYIVGPDETVTLSFSIWYQGPEIKGASYNIDLDLEAVQVTNGVPQALGWPELPIH